MEAERLRCMRSRREKVRSPRWDGGVNEIMSYVLSMKMAKFKLNKDAGLGVEVIYHNCI